MKAINNTIANIKAGSTLFARITPNFELELKTSKYGTYKFHYKYKHPMVALRCARKIAEKFAVTLDVKGVYNGVEEYKAIR